VAQKPTHILLLDGYVFMQGSKAECEKQEMMVLTSPDPRMSGAKTQVKRI